MKIAAWHHEKISMSSRINNIVCKGCLGLMFRPRDKYYVQSPKYLYRNYQLFKYEKNVSKYLEKLYKYFLYLVLKIMNKRLRFWKSLAKIFPCKSNYARNFLHCYCGKNAIKTAFTALHCSWWPPFRKMAALNAILHTLFRYKHWTGL